jgi:hypothetical protein
MDHIHFSATKTDPLEQRETDRIQAGPLHVRFTSESGHAAASFDHFVGSSDERPGYNRLGSIADIRTLIRNQKDRLAAVSTIRSGPPASSTST